MAAASLPSGLHTPPLADLVRLFSSATLTGYVRRQEAPSFARNCRLSSLLVRHVSASPSRGGGCADPPNTRYGFPACERGLPYSAPPATPSTAWRLIAASPEWM